MTQQFFPIRYRSPPGGRSNSHCATVGVGEKPLPISPEATIRPRNVTSPPAFQRITVENGGPKYRPHRAYASDSIAGGIGVPSPAISANRSSIPVDHFAVKPLKPRLPSKGANRTLQSSEERRKKTEELIAQQSQLRKEIEEETIRLSEIQQRRKLLQEEMERTEATKRENLQREQDNFRKESRYGRWESTPNLPDWKHHGQDRSNQSHGSWESLHAEDHYSQQDFRRPSRGQTGSTESVPLPNYHWWQSERARKEAERVKALKSIENTRNKERRAFLDAWEIYESRWMVLAFATRSSPPASRLSDSTTSTSSSTRLSLSFTDVPWPLLYTPRATSEITSDAIQSFFSSEFHSKDRTRRDRVREAVLKWHPDRFGTRMLEHIRPEDAAAVQEGVGIVIRSLNDILTN